MVLADLINDMNSNYENRKHGGNSQVFSMQGKILAAFPEIGVENLFVSEAYLPLGQRIEPGTLESLKVAVSEFQSQNDLEGNLKKLS